MFFFIHQKLVVLFIAHDIQDQFVFSWLILSVPTPFICTQMLFDYVVLPLFSTIYNYLLLNKFSVTLSYFVTQTPQVEIPLNTENKYVNLQIRGGKLHDTETSPFSTAFLLYDRVKIINKFNASRVSENSVSSLLTTSRRLTCVSTPRIRHNDRKFGMQLHFENGGNESRFRFV